MKRQLTLGVIISLLIAPLSTSSQTLSVTPSTESSSVVRYDRPHSEKFYAHYSSLSESRSLEPPLIKLRERLRLKGELPVVFKECGMKGASYLKTDQTVVLCYEYIAALAVEQIKLGGASTLKGLAAGEALKNAIGSMHAVLQFTAFHELAHAVIHQRQIPIFGKEEDAADNFAVVFLLDQGESGRITALKVAEYFASLAERMETSSTPMMNLPWQDEHSLDIQRMYNIYCLVYGSNPELHKALVTEKVLPPSRVSRCSHEYRLAYTSWTKLLKINGDRGNHQPFTE